MKSLLSALAALVGLFLSGGAPHAPAGPERAAPELHLPVPELHAPAPEALGPAHGSAAGPDDASLTDVVQEYCVRCHSDRRLRGNLSLEDFAVEDAAARAETAERMIKKLRAGMMPPPEADRPAGDSLTALAATLERTIDEAAARDPDPGDRPFQRLNRAEYERMVRELFGLEVDAGTWLPPDQISASFDNVADAQAFSPTLMDAYLNAASDIARQVVGQADAAPVAAIYRNEAGSSQHEWERVEGAPYGTRGGISVLHTFPADGRYVVSLSFISGWGERFHDVDVSVDGERVALLRYQGSSNRLIDFQGRLDYPVRTDSLQVKAGQRRITAAFVRKMEGPYEDLIRPNEWSLAGTEASYGTTSLPHITQMTVEGPYDPTGVSETPTRRRLFTCRPTAPDEARPCAEDILSRLARTAYRRPLEDRDVEALMRFYDEGASAGGFERGVRTALEALLASPHFLFRVEDAPEGVEAGEIYPIEGEDLASRLAFFLWGEGPDARLLELAGSGALQDPETLRSETLRMLDDPRSEALATRFASLWLRLQDLEKVRPDAFWYPNYSRQVADDMRRETELFFWDLVRRDGSLLELLTAEHTFLNERLARHYGIGGVVGDEFRRVAYPGDRRRGLLGQGSVLVQTSYGNRTSPVLRGKWVMEVLLGTPPPPPPPNVPELDETAEGEEGRALTTAERLEMHRANPSCNSCHQLIDPIGLALDHFDVTGQYRIREDGVPLDTRGTFYDGTPIHDAASLVDALLQRPIPFVRNFTETLMTYALGRRVDHRDQPTVRAIADAARDDGYALSAFLTGVVTSDAFRLKRARATTQDQQ